MKFAERMRRLTVQISQVYLCLRSPKTPWYAKVMAGIAVACALSPIDLIPDCIPILGCLDDLVFVPLFVFLTAKLVPRALWDSFAQEAETRWKDGPPKKWYYAIPIVVLYLAALWLLLRWIL